MEWILIRNKNTNKEYLKDIPVVIKKQKNQNRTFAGKEK